MDFRSDIPNFWSWLFDSSELVVRALLWLADILTPRIER